MRNDDLGDAFNMTIISLANSTKLLLCINFGFASLAIVLAGLCGFLAGRLRTMRAALPEGQRAVAGLEHATLPARTHAQTVQTEDAPAVAEVLEEQQEAFNPFSSRPEAQRVPSFARQGPVQGPDSSETTALTTETQTRAVAALVQSDSERWNLRLVPEDLQPAYTRYISRWLDTDLPWAGPASVRASHLGSRLQSMASGISTAMTASEVDEDWRPMGWRRDSAASTVASQLLFTDWRIQPSQLQFCYDPNGELITLSCRSGPRPAWQSSTEPPENCRAILDGKINVAVKVIKMPRGAIQEATINQLVMQLLIMNDCQQFTHFWGICQNDTKIMLVSEYVEGGCMREARKRDCASMHWYQNGKAIARSLAQALVALHRNKLEHKGLKSNKVLVRASDNTVKVCGLLNETLTQHTRRPSEKRLASAFDWTAPEVFLGKRHGPAADIFAFGVILWELITQEFPIRGALRDARVPSECPAAIRKLMNDCKARNPADRPSAAKILDTIQMAWNIQPDGTRAEGAELSARGSGLSARGSGLAQRPPTSPLRASSGNKSHNASSRHVQVASNAHAVLSAFTQPQQHGEAVVADERVAASLALTTMQSAPLGAGKKGLSPDARGRIEDSLRSGMEKVYAFNRNLAGPSRHSPQASRRPELVSYMSRNSQGSRSPSPELMDSPGRVDTPSPERRDWGQSSAHPLDAEGSDEQRAGRLRRNGFEVSEKHDESDQPPGLPQNRRASLPLEKELSLSGHEQRDQLGSRTHSRHSSGSSRRRRSVSNDTEVEALERIQSLQFSTARLAMTPPWDGDESPGGEVVEPFSPTMTQNPMQLAEKTSETLPIPVAMPRQSAVRLGDRRISRSLPSMTSDSSQGSLENGAGGNEASFREMIIRPPKQACKALSDECLPQN